MEGLKKKGVADMNNRDIVFSKAIKAGKRIYYLDVKKNRKEEMFLAITESKKVISGEGDDTRISFEKHKIFLYKEDFEKFLAGMNEAIDYIYEKQGPDTRSSPLEAEVNSLADEQITTPLSQEIDIDIDFD